MQAYVLFQRFKNKATVANNTYKSFTELTPATSSQDFCNAGVQKSDQESGELWNERVENCTQEEAVIPSRITIFILGIIFLCDWVPEVGNTSRCTKSSWITTALKEIWESPRDKENYIPVEFQLSSDATV